MSDADNILDRCRLELGDPDATYAVTPGRFWAKFGLMLLLTVGGAGAIAAWVIFGGRGLDGIVAKFLITPPIIGVGLLWHMYRTRGLYVLLYPTGLLRLQRGELESYPWGELTEVKLKADKGSVEIVNDIKGEIVSCWVAVEVPAFQLWNAALTVTRADGTTATLTPSVSGYADLVERVQRATFPQLWAPAVARLRAGQAVSFGVLEVRPDGLGFGGKVAKWRELDDASVAGKVVSVKRKGKWLPWAAAPLNGLANPHVLLALIEEARRAAQPELRPKPPVAEEDAIGL